MEEHKKIKKGNKRRLPISYWEYLSLLAITLVLFSIYALKWGDTYFSFEIKRMGISKYSSEKTENLPTDASDTNVVTTLYSDSVNADIPLTFADSISIQASINGGDYTYPHIDTVNDSGSGERFLLLGDSMNEFLRLRLNDYCIANGHSMNCVIWYGATTLQYGTCDTIAYFIRKHHPTYILLTIGSNELFIRNIKEKRLLYVQHIIRQMGNIPFLWIGPPNWKDDTGINDLIVSNVGTSRYFESKKLTFKRCKDGAHPTKSSAFEWMDKIASYLSTNAAKTVLMNNPDTTYNRIPHTTILKMVR